MIQVLRGVWWLGKQALTVWTVSEVVQILREEPPNDSPTGQERTESAHWFVFLTETSERVIVRLEVSSKTKDIGPSSAITSQLGPFVFLSSKKEVDESFDQKKVRRVLVSRLYD